MLSIDRFQEIAEEIVDSLPAEFFYKLNGGVIVSEEVKLHRDSSDNAPLYVNGLYSHSYLMGQNITLYYGSFIRTFGHLSEQQQRTELRRIIHHEFRHHMEWLSGVRALADEDEEQLRRYNQVFNSEDSEL